MFTWLAENLGTVLITLVLLLVVAAIVYGLLRNRKKGRSSCGGHCASCPMGGSCHRH